MYRSLSVLVGMGLVLGCSAQHRPAEPVAYRGQAQPAGAAVDLERRPLDKIPVGTVIGDDAPEGWSHLVLIAIPTLTEEDERDAPATATHYARMFKFTVLGDVARREGGGDYYLRKVGRGFATTVRGRETIVSGEDTLGARLGLFGKTILAENERILDEDVRQVARTDTMLIFDAKAVMRRDGKHVPMIMRHALLVEPDTGKLYTLVWLLTPGYEAAEDAMQLLPEGMHEQRLLSVDRSKFSRLGIPSKDAFALRRVPPGTAVPYTPALREAARTRQFTRDNVPQVEATLRDAARQAAKG